MDISKATGADSFPAKVIRTAAPYISNVVTNLFNVFFQYTPSDVVDEGAMTKF